MFASAKLIVYIVRWPALIISWAKLLEENKYSCTSQWQNLQNVYSLKHHGVKDNTGSDSAETEFPAAWTYFLKKTCNMKCNVSIVFCFFYGISPLNVCSVPAPTFVPTPFCWCLVRCLELVCVCSISLKKYFVHENDHDINMDTNVFLNTNIKTSTWTC